MILNKFFLKYTADKILAFILLVLVSPLILVIFLAVWTEGLFYPEARGPALYRETRISQGKAFGLYKFRTVKFSLIKNMPPTNSVSFLQVDKKNTTSFGRWLIKFYLDELPQVFNVLKGQMSLVGPRPRIPAVYNRDLEKGYNALQYIKAGITGPHQLTKGTTWSMEESQGYCKKVQTYGALKLLSCDLNILCRTFFKVLKGEGL